MIDIELVNGKNPDRKLLFEQYKIIVESAERITEKRQAMNGFYVTLNTFVLGLSGYLATLQSYALVSILVSILGIIICTVWWHNIESFKKLNFAKFKIIHSLEKYLPANVYTVEDEFLKRKYYQITSIEKNIPFTVGAFYASVILINLFVLLL